MTRPPTRGRRLTVELGVAVLLGVVPLGLTACGGDDAKEKKPAAEAAPTPLAITTSDAGSKRLRTTAPKSIKGGLVNLTFKNAGKEPHEAQLIRLDGAHTPQEVIKIVTTEGPTPIPEWFHAAGGTGTTAPGQTAAATLNLPAGNYMMIDNEEGERPSNAERGALATFKVTAGENGALPESTATITATTEREHENSFEISGLKVGKNRLRFVNKGDELHHAVMFPILPGKTIADVKQAFAQEGRPSGPPPVDFENGANTGVLDGDTEQVADLVLRKPGKYAVVCFLTDRNGKGKPHLAEGMLEEVDVR